MMRLFFTLTFIALTINAFTQTTLTLRPNATEGKDRYVWDYMPTTNLTDEFSIYAWTYNGTPTIRRCFIDFDFSLIPVGATINSATLFLYNYPNSTSCNGEHSQLSGTNEMYVERVTELWNENTINWNNQPNTTTINQISVPASSSIHQNYVINVTSIVQDMVDYPSTSFGFRLKLQTEQYYRSVIFASSHVADSTLHPKIQIVYTPVGIEENAGLGNLQIFPNPSKGKFVVNNINKVTSIEIFNELGEMVKNMNNLKEQASEEIDLSDYAKGIYTVKFFNGEKFHAEKLIIE